MSLRLADLPQVAAGKIRDLHRVDDEHVLMVASDRISAYDWVLPTPIPDKGRVLTALSAWWFDRFPIPHHFVTVDGPNVPDEVRGRALLCRSLTMVPVECVARGYLAGTGLAEYRRSGTVCGIPLPPGLCDGDRLPEPIFTPSTKALVAGEHDEAMSFDDVVALVGGDLASRLRAATLEVYRFAERVARERGVLLADTKLEFGHDRDGTLRVGDEVLTPDSSRFWPASDWRPGRAQPSFDKQYVRDWLAGESGWDRTGPPPPLPEPVVAATRDRYVEAYQRISGRSLADWPRPPG